MNKKEYIEETVEAMDSNIKSICLVTPEEMKTAGDWVSAHLEGKQPPFSFIYGGQSSVDFLKTWKFEKTSRALDDKRTEHVEIYTDPDTGLVVRSAAIEYHDFPTVEWTLYFKNTGSVDTPIMENIQALDLEIAREDLDGTSTAEKTGKKSLLHYNIGSPTTEEDYRPLIAELTPNSRKRIATSGGRSNNKHMPYFNLEWSGCGFAMAVGWPGQWAAEFSRDDADKLRICAGQELTHFKLHPGEEVRSPLIALQFYQGDWIRAQNIWRRWIIAHNMPRPGGSLPESQIAASTWLYFAPWGISNALTIKIFIDHYESRKIPIDACWIDAGWYECDFPEIKGGPEENLPMTPVGMTPGGETAGFHMTEDVESFATGQAPGDPSWPNTGTWRADPYRYPKGIRDVSDHAHAKGLKTILWFEPERVRLGSRLAEDHPDWLIAPPPNPGDQMYQEDDRLLNLGDSEVLRWLTDYIGEYLAREDIDVYREDFNMDPLYFWRSNEPEDRQGITEIKFVTNHLAYWDELLRRHPNLLIDNCASGCKRADLESMRRSVTFWRSDYLSDFTNGQSRLNANQCTTYGIVSWIPYFGSGGSVIDPYVFHSNMSPSYVFDFDPRSKDLDLELLRGLIAQFKQVKKYFFGDYYPLTAYSLEDDVWMAWQFDCPEIGEGMVQAFRREKNPDATARFSLRGLSAEEQYAVMNLDGGEARHLSGGALMEEGMHVEIPERPGSVIITYKRECK